MTSVTVATAMTAGTNIGGEKEEAQRKKEQQQGGGETLADLCQTAYLDLLEKQLSASGNRFSDVKVSYLKALLLLDERKKELAKLQKEELSEGEKQNENNKRKKNEEEEEKEKKNKEQEGDEFFAGATPPKGMSQEQFQVKLKQDVNKTLDGIVSKAFKESNEVVKATLRIQQGFLHLTKIVLRVASSSNTQYESASSSSSEASTVEIAKGREGKVEHNIPNQKLLVHDRASAEESPSEPRSFVFHKIIDCRQDKKQEGEEKNKIDNKLDEIFSALEVDKCVDEAVNIVSSCEILTSPQSSAACAAGEKNQKNQEQKQYRHELDEEEQARLKQEEEEEERQAKLNSSNNNNEANDSSSNDIKNFIKNFPTTGAEVHRSVFFSYGTTKSNKEEVFGIKSCYSPFSKASSSSSSEQKGEEEKEEKEKKEKKENRRRSLFLRAAEQVCQRVDELNKKEQEKKKKKEKEQQEEQAVSYKVSLQAFAVMQDRFQDLLLGRKEWPSQGHKPKLTLQGGYEVPTSEQTFTNVAECEKLVDIAKENYWPQNPILSSLFYSRRSESRFDSCFFLIRISKEILVDDNNQKEEEEEDEEEGETEKQQEGEEEEKEEKNKKKKVSYISSLLFVDLPSSERTSSSHNDSMTAAKSGSLLTNNSLMNCLAAMTKDLASSRLHIPTRSSKSTLVSLGFVSGWMRQERSAAKRASSNSYSSSSSSSSFPPLSFNLRILINVSDDIESYHDTSSSARLARHFFGSPTTVDSSSSSSSGIDEAKMILMRSSVLPPLDLAWRFKFEGVVQNSAYSEAASEVLTLLVDTRNEIDEIQKQLPREDTEEEEED